MSGDGESPTSYVNDELICGCQRDVNIVMAGGEDVGNVANMVP